MTISDRLLEAQHEAGGDPRMMCIYLAGVIEGLRASTQANVSGGYIRAHPDASLPVVDPPRQILARFEAIDGIDV